MDIGGMVQADRHHIRKLETHFFDPHILDSNVSTNLSFYKRWDEFEQWQGLNQTPTQRVLGGDARFGFWLTGIDKRLQLALALCIEDIKTNTPHAVGLTQNAFNPVLQRLFQEGTIKWFGLDLSKDTRDHQVYPKSGYRMILGGHIAPPGLNHQFSFLKVEAEASCYTALIGEDSLVLMLHGKMGNISTLAADLPVPYKELYHMGGQTTVRGFVWGSIGPAWRDGNNPIGASNALQFNAELIFPLIPDYSMKAHFFYDAGAGWDTPKYGIPAEIYYNGRYVNPVIRDSFDLRHSVGVGLNLLKPVPAKIDWGFKLDRKKQLHESASEFHLSMNYAW
jgi:outer membrane protein assembly factor BamA